MLATVGRKQLKEPQKLKTLLCPALVRNQAEQERFYELFDQWWEQHIAPGEAVQKPPFRKSVWFRILAAACVLALFAGGLWKLFLAPLPPQPVVDFEAPGTVRLGGTLSAINRSLVPDSENLHWEIADARTGKIEHKIESFNLHLQIRPPVGAAEKELRLVYKGALSGDTGIVVSRPLQITCPSPPAIGEVLIRGETLPGKEVLFELSHPENGVEYTWDFGDGSAPAKGAKTSHRYKTSDLYLVQLQANRTGEKLPCHSTKNINLNVAAQALALPALQLKKDQVEPVVTFGTTAWIALAMLAIGAVVFFLRKHRPQLPEETSDAALPDARPFAAPDRPPYFIPFRSNEQYISVPRELYRLADVLRIRQEGLRRELDVDTSLKRTINEGGYPHLVTKLSTLPTDYLILIDKSGRDNHLTRLFGFMADFLREREVHAEVFFFDTKPIRFWNQRHPGGLSRIQLWRMHQQHRLIVMADLHALLDPHSLRQNGAGALLKKEDLQFFSQWKYRILLTPQPVISWTWKEGALHELFPVFPSDSHGLAEFAKFMERDFLNADQPVYANWCERLLENRRESDTNYINWRNAMEIEQYFHGNYNLFQWFCALALYPRPEWPITLAIGKAMHEEVSLRQNEGLLTFDNLLILSRVPWLQKGEMPERLRKELLRFLYPEVEAIARRAIANELEAVASLVEGSHANREWQVNSTLQYFALEPQNPGVLKKVQQLKALDLLGRRDESQLNHSIQRFMYPWEEQRARQLHELMMKQSSRFEKAGPPPPPTIDEYLRKMLPQQEPPPPAQPVRKPGLWRNLLLTLLFFAMLFLLMSNLSGSERLARWAGFAEGIIVDCQETGKLGGLLKVNCRADSSILLNNQAVDDWKRWAGDRPVLSPLTYGKPAIAPPPQTGANLQRALDLEPNYQLASENLGAWYYNLGTWSLHGWLGTPTEPSMATTALHSFKAAEDRLPNLHKVLALHGEGLVYYYQSLPTYGFDEGRRKIATDSSAILLKQIEELTGGKFFDTTGIFPNLKSLMKTVKLESLNPQQPPSLINRQQNTSGRHDTSVQQGVEVPQGGTDLVPQLSDVPVPEMVFVPGDVFTMGCEKSRDGGCDPAEEPYHKVQLNSFYIGKYEVTNREFAAFLQDYQSVTVVSGPYKGQPIILEHENGIEFRFFQGEYTFRPFAGYEDYPAGGVTWYGAVAYCRWLSEKTGRKFRLPTEAEWEYAARGGPRSKGYTYAGSDVIGEVAVYINNSKERPQKVGLLRPNELGLYDCSGNLWEWCQDYFSESYYANSPVANPSGPASGKGRVYRGGSFLNAADFCRLATRSFNDPGFQQVYVGFRVVSDGDTRTGQ